MACILGGCRANGERSAKQNNNTKQSPKMGNNPSEKIVPACFSTPLAPLEEKNNNNTGAFY